MKLQWTGLCLAAIILFAVPAESATRTVRSRRDSGSGSLRQTVARARAGDTILLRTNGTIVLSSELVLDKNLTLRGVPAGLNRVSGGGSTRILRVAVGIIATLEGLILEQGSDEGQEGTGGAILNNGALTIRDCIFQDHFCGNEGGAIFNTGYLALTDSEVLRNTASGAGAGIFYVGTLSLHRCTLSLNSTTGLGGAILNREGNLTIDTCILSENHGDSDGAIGNAGHATISNSTLSHNGATSLAGGIGNSGAPEISNSTLSQNRSDSTGAIVNHGQLTIRSSTIVENFATERIGGIENNGSLMMGNTVVAYNRIGLGNPPGEDISGTITSLGHNLAGSSNGATGFVASDLLDVDPLLGPLQDNGGFTATHALRAGGPAIDAGDNALVDASVTTDQRGEEFLRFVDGDGDGTATVDIGAFEHQGADLRLVKQATGRALFGTRVTYTLTVRNLGAEVGEGVTVTDTLPNGAAFLSASTIQGTLTTPAPGAGGTVIVSLGDLLAGDTARIRITVRVATRPPLTNTAVVTAASFDPNLANNQDTVVLRR